MSNHNNVDRKDYAPENTIELSRSIIRENRKTRRPIGVVELAANDQNPDTPPEFELVSGPGDGDNENFRVSNGKIFAKDSFDYEVKNAYSIRVRANDGDGGVYEEVLPIAVRNVQEVDDVTGIRVGAAYDSTSVNFINNSQGAFYVRSADNRFESFVLSPGQQKRVTGSITGSDNFDVNADILILKLEPDRTSTYVGNMQFNNEVGIIGLAVERISSGGRTFLSPVDGRIRDGKNYYNYNLLSPTLGRRWQPIREGKANSVEFYPNIQGDYALSDDPDLLVSNVVFESYFFGSVQGQKRWDFVATQLPPI